MKMVWYNFLMVTLRVLVTLAVLLGSVLQAFAVAKKPLEPWDVPIELTIPEILSGDYDNKPAFLIGTVLDVIDDTSDPKYVFLLVTDSTNNILAPVKDAKQDYGRLKALIGARVQLTGLPDSYVQKAMRRHLPRRFNVTGIGGIKRLSAATDIFAAPDILTLDGARPEEIARASRHRTCGRALAVWGGDMALVETASNRLVRVEFADGDLPHCGDSIEAVGYPETDLCHVNLSRAQWRLATTQPPPPSKPPRAYSLTQLLEAEGISVFPLTVYGQPIRVRGTVKTLPRDGSFLLEDASHILTIDIGSLDNIPDRLQENCRLEATGIYIVDIDVWRPNVQFPKIRGVRLVVCKADDLRIITSPPWWTVGKLLGVIGGLLAVILALFIRNRLQKRFGTLKLAERTRLAVELHDTLAQNLTGVSMELEAASKLRGDAPPTMLAHVDIAAKALKSCRGELRNCLWDLRSQALEESDMTRAVRRTLQPLVTTAHLGIRFNVPRAALSDNTAHALLRIIRELVTNAIHHGKASQVRVAGTVDDGVLACSVTDNGCGFDPDAAPGVLQGHFGLQGIRERIQQLGGTFRLESAAGHGTKATITIQNPLS